MTNLRRVLALLVIAACMALPLAGCGGSNSQTTSLETTPIERAVPTTPQEEEQRAKESNAMSEEELAAAKAEGH